MSRKKITRQIRPLPKRPLFRPADNKTERLLALLRDVALSSQKPESQPFYPLREVAQKFGIPLSLGWKIYRRLEEEGILRPIRGSGTFLAGLNSRRVTEVEGVVAIASSLSRFLNHQDYRMFVTLLCRELRTRNFAASRTFFEVGESAGDIAGRLKESRPDTVIWYSPEKVSREVAGRLHDLGIAIIAICGSGSSHIGCDYVVRRQLAVSAIVRAWKKQSITTVKVAVGPSRSSADEEKIGRTLEDLEIEAKFVTPGSGPLKEFFKRLAAGPSCGIIVSHATAVHLSMNAPEALGQLAKGSPLALIDGPISVPLAKFTELIIDLVAVDWAAAAKLIGNDLSNSHFRVSGEPRIFEAAALLRVPLSRYAQKLWPETFRSSSGETGNGRGLFRADQLGPAGIRAAGGANAPAVFLLQ